MLETIITIILAAPQHSLTPLCGLQTRHHLSLLPETVHTLLQHHTTWNPTARNFGRFPTYRTSHHALITSLRLLRRMLSPQLPPIHLSPVYRPTPPTPPNSPVLASMIPPPLTMGTLLPPRLTILLPPSPITVIATLVPTPHHRPLLPLRQLHLPFTTIPTPTHLELPKRSLPDPHLHPPPRPGHYLRPTYTPRKVQAGQNRRRQQHLEAIHAPPPLSSPPILLSSTPSHSTTPATTRNISIAQWNIGGGGLSTNYQPLLTYISTYHPDVIHISDSKTTKERSPKITELLESSLSEYKVYITNKSKHDSSKSAIAIFTLIHRDMVPYLTQLGHRSPLSAGRLLSFKLALPSAPTPIYFAHAYMATAGDRTKTNDALYTELSHFIHLAQNDNAALLISGDLNATIRASQRTGYTDTSSTIKHADSTLRTFINVYSLTCPRSNTPHANLHTWHSHNYTKSATLDHTLMYPPDTITSTTQHQSPYSTTDHDPLLHTLSSAFPPPPSRPSTTRTPRIDFTNRKLLSSQWKEAVTAAMALTDSDDWSEYEYLSHAQFTALDLAHEIYGFTSRKPRKPFRSSEIIQLNKELSSLRTLRRHTHAHLHTISLAPHLRTSHTISALHLSILLTQAILKNSSAGALQLSLPPLPSKSDLDALLLIITPACESRNSARGTALRKMNKERLQQVVKFKISELFRPGSRAIQKAMKKTHNNTPMTHLVTTHPDTVTFLLPSHSRLSMQADITAYLRTHLIKTTSHLHRGLLWVQLDQHHHLSDLIAQATLSHWPITSVHNHEHTTPLANRTPHSSPSNILSAIEAELGDNGRAACTQCSLCLQSRLNTISRVVASDRTTQTYCHDCKTTVPTQENETYYDTLPMKETLLTRGRHIPRDTHESLRGTVTLPELRIHVKAMRDRKSAGDDCFPPELWRDAPDALLLPLLAAINHALEIGKMPDVWRGGIVRFLLKRDPSLSLSNWRPVCLLRVAYKIYSRVITTRLRDLVEKYQLLEYVQEGFRSRRSTRRQVERLWNILAAARGNKHAVFMTFIDFTNAFNASDHRCILKTLGLLGIPDLDLIGDLLAGSSFRSTNEAGTTAPIPLNRGVKQGAVESPLIFCLFVNSLLRFLHDANVGIETSYDTSNSAGFADDLCLFTSSRSPKHAESQHAELLRRLSAFSAWANIHVNIKKCAISAYDFNKKQPLLTADLTLNNLALPSYTKSQAYKYLGIHLALDGNMKAETDYIKHKMREAVQCLYRTVYLPEQVNSLVEICILPIFKYSAPFTPWTNSDLKYLQSLLTKARKFAYKLPLQTASAPFELAAKDGGLDHAPIAHALLREQDSHMRQCLQHDDAVRNLFIAHNTSALLSIGAHTPAQAQTALLLHPHHKALRSSILLRHLKLLSSISSGISSSLFNSPEPAPRITTCSDTILIHHPPPPPLPSPELITSAQALAHDTHNTHLAATASLIRSGCTTILPLLSHDNTSIRHYKTLPKSIRSHLTRKAFNTLRTLLLSPPVFTALLPLLPSPNPLASINQHFHPTAHTFLSPRLPPLPPLPSLPVPPSFPPSTPLADGTPSQGFYLVRTQNLAQPTVTLMERTGSWSTSGFGPTRLWRSTGTSPPTFIPDPPCTFSPLPTSWVPAHVTPIPNSSFSLILLTRIQESTGTLLSLPTPPQTSLQLTHLPLPSLSFQLSTASALLHSPIPSTLLLLHTSHLSLPSSNAPSSLFPLATHPRKHLHQPL